MRACSVTWVVSDSLWPYGSSFPSGSTGHGDSPGKDTGLGCHTLLQKIFLTQGLNPCLLCLLHCQEGSLLRCLRSLGGFLVSAKTSFYLSSKLYIIINFSEASITYNTQSWVCVLYQDTHFNAIDMYEYLPCPRNCARWTTGDAVVNEVIPLPQKPTI